MNWNQSAKGAKELRSRISSSIARPTSTHQPRSFSMNASPMRPSTTSHLNNSNNQNNSLLSSMRSTGYSLRSPQESLIDSALLRSTADGFTHGKPRKVSPLRYDTYGNWSVLMDRTSPQTRCGSHTRRRIQTSDAFADSKVHLSPHKHGYNVNVNDGQFRIRKTHATFWKSDILNQKALPNNSTSYIYSAGSTQNDITAAITTSTTPGSPISRSPKQQRQDGFYDKFVATNSNFYYGVDSNYKMKYLERRRETKDLSSFIHNKMRNNNNNNNNYSTQLQSPRSLVESRIVSSPRAADVPVAAEESCVGNVEAAVIAKVPVIDTEESKRKRRVSSDSIPVTPTCSAVGVEQRGNSPRGVTFAGIAGNRTSESNPVSATIALDTLLSKKKAWNNDTRVPGELFDQMVTSNYMNGTANTTTANSRRESINYDVRGTSLSFSQASPRYEAQFAETTRQFRRFVRTPEKMMRYTIKECLQPYLVEQKPKGIFI